MGATLLGLAPIGIRLSELGPQATNLWRFIFALPILFALALATGKRPRPKDAMLLISGGFVYATSMGLWAAAVNYTTVANATFLGNMAPLFAVGIAWIVWRERVGSVAIKGGVTALAGALLLAVGRVRTGVGPADVALGWLGDTLALTSAIGFAAYYLIIRLVGNRVSLAVVMLLGTSGSAILASLLTAAIGEEMLPQTGRGWGILVGLGVVAHAAGQGLMTYGVARLPIAVSTILLLLQALAAAMLSWLLFGEALGPVSLVGVVLILAGLIIVRSHNLQSRNPNQ